MRVTASMSSHHRPHLHPAPEWEAGSFAPPLRVTASASGGKSSGGYNSSRTCRHEDDGRGCWFDKDEEGNDGGWRCDSR
jgi:hypothetical protein